jgi:WD40 repeat protein
MKSTIHTIKSRVAAKTGVSEEEIVTLFEDYCTHLRSILSSPTKTNVAVLWGTLKMGKKALKKLIGKLEHYKKIYQEGTINLYVLTRTLTPHDDFLSSLNKEETKEYLNTVGEEEILRVYEEILNKYKTLLHEDEQRCLTKYDLRKHKRILAGKLPQDSSGLGTGESSS